MSGGLGIVVDPKPKPVPKNMHELTQQINNPNAIDINVSYIKIMDKTVLNNTSTNCNSTSFTDIGTNPYSGLDWHQKMHIWWISINQVYKW
jgi:hypothetical protein